jgi:hypothetical protein
MIGRHADGIPRHGARDARPGRRAAFAWDGARISDGASMLTDQNISIFN